MGRPEKVAKKIKALQIQGARRIAKAAVEALAEAAKKSGAKTADELYSDLLVAADILAGARETEPMLRNFLEDLLSIVKSMRGQDVRRIKESLDAEQGQILRYMERSSRRIAAYGATLVPKRGAVLIHCHSTTLMMMLELAHADGKRPKIYCTETRPLYQGRMSALELARAGLDVTLIVDSAAGGLLAAKKIDVVFVGADAITARGELLNKVGTYPIALAAKEAGVKVFTAAELHKFDPNTEDGRAERIEQRGGNELADGKKMAGEFERAKVKILNPAFDITPPALIHGFVTEEGIVAPSGIAAAAKKTLGVRIHGQGKD